MFARKNLLICLTLAVALFFRFYNLDELQFWTSDEETAAIAVRKMIVEQKPLLIIPNSTLGTSLGPYFHYFSIPLFKVANLNPNIVLSFMGILGVATTYLIILICKSVKQEKVGLLASFLFASSFVMGLVDRRWWPLSLNPLLCAISVYSLLQIKIHKNYLFAVPLATCIGFAIHADPSIAIIAFASVFSFLFLKIPIFKKVYLLAILTLVFFLAPLIIFEARHPGTITKPYMASFQKNYNSKNVSPIKSASILISQTATAFSNLTFAKPDKFAERYIASSFYINNSYLGSFLALILILACFYPLANLKSKKVDASEKNFLIVLYSFMGTFAIASLCFTILFQKDIYQHYFTIIHPIFFILVGYTTIKLVKKKATIAIFVATYFISNLLTLTTSSFKYPLKDKMTVVKNISETIGSNEFSLYSRGDAYFIGGGYTTLMILSNKHPKKSSDYEFYDWMYKAYSFYTVEPSIEDQDKIVIISQTPSANYPADKIQYQESVGNIHSIVLDNTERWFKN